MDFVIHRHAEIAFAFGLAALVVWWLARSRAADATVRRSLTALCVLLALQGAVGLDQYEMHLPTELVWVHVALACAAWIAALWAAYAAGSLAPRTAPAPEPQEPRVAPPPVFRPDPCPVPGPAPRVSGSARSLVSARNTSREGVRFRKLGLLSSSDPANWPVAVLPRG